MDEDEADLPSPEEAPAGPGRRLKSSSLLWFISSRPYVPMADIRRRFGLATESGTWLRDDDGPIHIGLPAQAAETLLDLKRRGKVELQVDLEYATRIAVGVFPLRVRLGAPPAPVRAPQPPVAPLAPNDDLGARPPEDSAEMNGGEAVARPTARRRRRRRR